LKGAAFEGANLSATMIRAALSCPSDIPELSCSSERFFQINNDETPANFPNVERNANKKFLRNFFGERSTYASVSFNHEGTRIVSSGVDGTIRTWDPIEKPPVLVGSAWQRGSSGQGHIVWRRDKVKGDQVVSWSGEAWKYYCWEVDKQLISAEWQSSGKELFDRVPLELFSDVPKALASPS
jgi:WD40 repeat protein